MPACPPAIVTAAVRVAPRAGNKRTGKADRDQELHNCNAGMVNSVNEQDWRKSKPVRVIRGRKVSARACGRESVVVGETRDRARAGECERTPFRLCDRACGRGCARSCILPTERPMG